MRIGLIAGNGRFPFLVIDAARSLGHEVTVVAIREEADVGFESFADGRAGIVIHWISLGQLGRCIAILKEAGVSRVLMAGQVLAGCNIRHYLRLCLFVPAMVDKADLK